MGSRLRHVTMRLARLSVRVFGWSVLVFCALLVLLFATLELPVSKNLLKAQVNASLRPLFKGTLVVDRIGSVGIFGLDGIDAHVIDAQGHRVLVAKGLRTKSIWPRMLPAIIRGKPLVITLDRASCDHLEVALIDDGRGSPTLAAAFLPRKPEPSSQPSSTSIVFPAIRAKHVWVHGGLPSMPLVDVEARDISASFAQRPDRMQAQLDHLSLQARAMPARVAPSGTLRGSVLVPSAPGASPSVSGSFEGTLWGASSSLRARLVESHLQAELIVKQLKSDTLREFVPALTLHGETSMNVRADGQLPNIHFDALADNSALHMALHGAAELGAIKSLKANLDVTRLDLAQLTSAPTSHLEVRLSTSVKQSTSGRTEGSFSIEIPQGRAGGQLTPPTTTNGTLLVAENGSLDLDGNLNVNEPGAFAQLKYHLTSVSAEQRVARGTLSVQFTRPARAKRLLGLTASGSLFAQGQVDLVRSKLSSTLLLDVQPLTESSTSVGILRVRAEANGALKSPSFDIDSSATDVTLGARHFSHVLLAARGTAESCALRAQIQEGEGRIVELSTRVAPRNLTELIEPRATIRTKNIKQISLGARAIRYSPSVIQLDQLEVAGAGELKADGVVGERRTDLRFSLSDFQIARFMEAIGLPSEVRRATFNAQGHVSGSIRRLEGDIKGRIENLEFRQFRGGEIGIDISVKHNIVDALIDAKLERSHLTARLQDFDIPSGRVTRHSLLNTRGKALTNGSLDLERAQPLLRALGVPIEHASGQLLLDLQLENPRTGPAAPKLNISIKTKGLKFVEARKQPTNVETASAARSAQPESIEGIDLDATMGIDSNKQSADLNASLFDKQGPLARLSAESKLPDLAKATSLAVFEHLPMKVEAVVPERSLAQLPLLVRPQGMKGNVAARMHFEGTALDPKFDATVAVDQLKYRPRVPGIRANASLHYESDRGELSAIAFSGDRKVALASSHWSGNLLKKLTDAAQYASFSLDSELTLNQFPVGVIPALADSSIRGVVSCDVQLRDWGKNADLKAQFDGGKLTIRNQRIAALQATLEANDRDGLRARLHAEQNPGELQAQFDAPMLWGARLAPAMGTGARAALRASRFQVEALSPLLLPTVSELQGVLDANLDVQLTDGAPQLKGIARLQQATVEVPQIGQRFSDVAAQVSIDGPEVRLDSLQARGTTGRVTASAQARLNGTDLQSVKARLDIGSKEKLPVTFEGVEIGEAWGHIDFAYQTAEQGKTIRVDVPSFHMQLPEESMASVQSLDPDEHVQVGMFGRDGRFVAIPVQPLTKSDKDEPDQAPPMKVQIHLGDSVWVQRAQQAKVQLSGDLTVIAGEPTKIDGRIDLRGGTLDVNGKTFHIESGTVAFTGADSTDPTITATARWDSPAGYTVYAQFAGTVKQGKLTLRAEPQLTQNEIISLLLFGSPEGALGASAGGGGTAATAVGVAGDTATRGLNRMINDFTHLDVSARIDTSTGSARPELVVQVTPRLTTRVTRALGEPAPGQSPDRTFLTLELRLRRAWALSGVVGDRGASSLDLIWRHRY